MEGEMAARVNKKSNSDTDKSQLSKQDLRLMLVMCTELVNLCAKVTGRIDPAAAAMLAYVRDDIASENNLESLSGLEPEELRRSARISGRLV
jgi:hypothetical protein